MTEGRISKKIIFFCHSIVSGELVSAVVQYCGFPDRGKFFRKQCTGGGQFIWKSDLFDGRFY